MALSTTNYEWITAGFDACQWSYLDSSGILTGKADLTTASGDRDLSSNLGRLRGAIAAPFTLNDPQLEEAVGRDGSIEYLLGNITKTPTFILEVAAVNVRFMEAANGLPNIFFNGKGRRRIPIIERGAPRRWLFLMFSRRSLKLADEDYVTDSFDHLQLYRSECVYLGSGHAFQTAGSYRFLVVTHEQEYTPEGVLATSLFDTSIPGGKLSHDILFTSYPFSMVVTMGGITSNTVVTPAYVPAAANRIYAYKDGVSQTISTIDTSAPSITLAAAMGDTTRTITTYEATELD